MFPNTEAGYKAYWASLLGKPESEIYVPEHLRGVGSDDPAMQEKYRRAFASKTTPHRPAQSLMQEWHNRG